MNALTALRGYLARFRARCEAMAWHGAAIHAENCADITAEAIAESNAAAQRAYSAEQADREAARLLALAQAPQSDGGAHITPREAAPILRLVQASAERDHDLSETLTVSASA